VKHSKVDVRLPGKGNSNSHGARPVHLIIEMIQWIRTSRLAIENSLSLEENFIVMHRICSSCSEEQQSITSNPTLGTTNLDGPFCEAHWVECAAVPRRARI